MRNDTAQKAVVRAPIVVVMGHVDHGKSKLLDYIRKTNIVDKEAGGITQHISAYEVVQNAPDGSEKRITFLDTPGHEAFGKMRSRGANIADIAILVVSAEDGVKQQTLEALQAIQSADIPYIVAINKIDKPTADVERTKMSLLENGIYLEGWGGDIPFVAISAKTGEGVPELLEMMLLVAEIQELKAETDIPAEGVVIESNVDPKKGVTATLVIKRGTIERGMYIAAENSIAPVRIFEDFLGRQINHATVSSPVRIVGWTTVPSVGAEFVSFTTKKEAESYAATHVPTAPVYTSNDPGDEESVIITVPIVIRADVTGTLEAIEHEIGKLGNDRVRLKVVSRGVGPATEADINLLAGSSQPIILCFNVKIDSGIERMAEHHGVTLKRFDIIYKMAEWLDDAVRKRTPKVSVETATGGAKVLKVFNAQKGAQVIGGRATSGIVTTGDRVHIKRAGETLSIGTVSGIQCQRVEVKSVDAGNEFGARIVCEIDIRPGDEIEPFTVTEK